VGPGSGGGSGGGTGGGIGSGTGTGTGAGRMQAPVPEFVLIPPSNPPRGVRGDSLVIRLQIDATGKVRDVEFRSTGDRGYDQKLRRTAMEWRFRPARGPDNRPTAVAYDVTLQF
jgi:protein TonB